MFLCKFNILHTGGASPSPTTEKLNFVRRRYFKQKFNHQKTTRAPLRVPEILFSKREFTRAVLRYRK